MAGGIVIASDGLRRYGWLTGWRVISAMKAEPFKKGFFLCFNLIHTFLINIATTQSQQ